LKVYEENNSLIIEGLEHFNLEHTFLCGQCFRWEQMDDGSFSGVTGGKVYQIRDLGGTFVIDNATYKDYNYLKKYLDLERDYGKIKQTLSKNELLKKAINVGWGIRILRQDFFETLISYIISQQNNIKRITKLVNALCEKYGKPIFYKGKTYYAFPTPEELSAAAIPDLLQLGLGYRAEYVYYAVKDVLSGRISEEILLDLPTNEARKLLLSMKGVGDKVCDCIMLFSLGKSGLFPVDVWIRRVMEENYSSDNPKEAGEAMFGELSGFAQQYLFYYRRSQKVG